MKLHIIAVVLVICAGCASRNADLTTVHSVLNAYAPGDMHSQMEDGPDEWHDGATFTIERPEKWKGKILTVFFPSEMDNSPFRAVVGTKYEFKIEEELVNAGSSAHIFDGALRELKELKDNPTKPSTTTE